MMPNDTTKSRNHDDKTSKLTHYKSHRFLSKKLALCPLRKHLKEFVFKSHVVFRLKADASTENVG